MSEEESEGSLIEQATEAAGELASAADGIPAPIKKNFWKTFGQLCTSATDIGVAHLEGKASDIRANTAAREALTKTATEKIAEQMNIPAEYAEIAVHKHASKIVREQINKDKTVNIAKKQLENLSEEEIQTASNEEISDDWINVFEDIAGQCSSEKMQALFGKILSNEIRRPSSFSIKSIKTIHELDAKTAAIFQKFCSYAIGFKLHPKMPLYNRVFLPGLNGGVGQNSLDKHGLSVDSILRLIDNGLVNSEIGLSMSAAGCVVAPSAKNVTSPIYYRGKPIALRQQEENATQKSNFSLSGGVNISSVGLELLPVVELLPEDEFTDDLKTWLENQKLKMEEVRLF